MTLEWARSSNEVDAELNASRSAPQRWGRPSGTEEPNRGSGSAQGNGHAALNASDQRPRTAMSDFSPQLRAVTADPSSGLLPRPSLGRQASRSLARSLMAPCAGFLMAACIGAAANLVWQPYSGVLKKKIAGVPQLNLTTSVPPADQVSTPAESSSKRFDGESAPHSDRGVVTPTETAPTTAQKTTAMQPAVMPQKTQEKNGRNRLRPVPETRPTTIEGWTVRNVSGAAAVLQGPNGIRRVSVGETVPGAGRIDSIVRWGNRWIVATSRGLITTD
jgi:hypothetical protein